MKEKKKKKEIYIYVLLYKSIKKDYREDKGGSVIAKNAEIMHYMIFFSGGMYRKRVNSVYFEFEHMENLIDKSKTNELAMRAQ